MRNHIFERTQTTFFVRRTDPGDPRDVREGSPITPVATSPEGKQKHFSTLVKTFKDGGILSGTQEKFDTGCTTL